MNFCLFIASSSALIDFWRPTKSGTTMCGKTMMSRSGKRGTTMPGRLPAFVVLFVVAKSIRGSLIGPDSKPQAFSAAFW
jgi:hypothetical protein